MDVFNTLMKADVVLVFIVSIGLLIQKKKFKQIIVSVIKASVGYAIIVLGSDIALKTLSILSLVIRRSLHIFDILPSNETMISITGNYNGKNTLIIMFMGMIINIIIARFTKFKYIFINGYYILYMAGMLALLINDNPSNKLVAISGIYLGIIMSILPYMTSFFIKKIANRDDIGLAHFGSLACLVGGVCANVFRNSKDKEQTKKKLTFMRDSNFLIAMSMFIIYLILILNVEKDFLYDFTGETSKIYIAFKYSIIFTTAFYLIILGVRMMTDEILYSFKGIAEKIIIDAKPAVDTAVFFTYNPEIVIIGFIISLIGGIITALFQIKFKYPVVVPSVITHFFSGGMASLFGFSIGKKGGAILSAFIHGIIISIIPVFLMPLLKPHIGLMRTCYADSDFGIFAMLFYYIRKIINV
ncbi:PTS transporter subunit IIC [Clostridium tetani]|uniref:Ascorbate-specific PTS system EIIC component n=1 Tax=Clostridium tetani TaxID=1513 RepID=A0ABY0ESG7_CLOTA|nr:PTS transporter subunit IIC [Clostridium tetani]KHO40343.1 PTS ascorbate transporter subunit IIC [Clostridium tetani]RXI58510.1 PTS ascorbate transporter subunit IIC [Clostridium tetani]RXI73222.1 PTS ascorbate transporter subunit IIC [Clostridium tetani]